jgi:two-component system, cell cycle sensor histidine kinase and response regulator CckA
VGEETVDTEGSLMTILVVDDEEPVRELLGAILSEAGYQVTLASGGKDALLLYRRRGPEISLVLLDLLMPEMSGLSLLQSLLRLNPAVKAIVVSGASYEGKDNESLASGARGVVEKPFQPEELLATVERVLRS